jgi:hypothetical protein
MHSLRRAHGVTVRFFFKIASQQENPAAVAEQVNFAGEMVRGGGLPADLFE